MEIQAGGELLMMRLTSIDKQSTVNGPGINFCLWTQGCRHNCKECFNPSTHDYDGGYEVSMDDLFEKIKSTKLITGVTFSGGEPLDQAGKIFELAFKIKTKLKLTVNLYTGYTLVFDDTTQHCFLSIAGKISPETKALPTKHFKYIDNIFDGRFDIDKRSYDTPFRGSSNQRWLKRGTDF